MILEEVNSLETARDNSCNVDDLLDGYTDNTLELYSTVLSQHTDILCNFNVGSLWATPTRRVMITIKPDLWYALKETTKFLLITTTGHKTSIECLLAAIEYVKYILNHELKTLNDFKWEDKRVLLYDKGVSIGYSLIRKFFIDNEYNFSEDEITLKDIYLGIKDLKPHVQLLHNRAKIDENNQVEVTLCELTHERICGELSYIYI